MSTRRANRLRRTVHVAVPTGPVDPLDPIKAKFARLAELRGHIEAAKHLYQEHDRLVEELLPMFITKTAEKFEVKRQITLGDKVFRLVPYFYDQEKDKIKVKQWKSTAFTTMTIESCFNPQTIGSNI